MKNAHFTKKNHRAITQLRNWFTAVGIEAKAGNDISVTTARGDAVDLQVIDSGDPGGGLVISAAVITGRRIQDALAAFRAIQVSLGYEPKSPVNRGTPPEHKAHFSDDFELVAFRHTELHRTANPPPGMLEKYERVICKEVWFFKRGNEDLCRNHLLEFEDLRTYAQVWSTNYLGLWALPADQEGKDGTENARLLAAHLRQRFSNFRDLIYKKERNVLATPDTIAASHDMAVIKGKNSNLGSRLVGGRAPSSDFALIPADETTDEDYVTRHCQLDTKNDKTRRASAATMLEEGLAKLANDEGHDRMVEVLQESAENYKIHPDAQKLATKLLNLHRSTCQNCKHLSALPEIDEDLVTEDAGGIEE